MKVNLVIGKFRSKDNARLAIWELGEQGFMKVSFHQLTDDPVEGVDPMNNAYSAELPLYARGVMGSDVAVEGRSSSNLYNEEDAKKMMGEGTHLPAAYAVAVNVTESDKPHFAVDILNKHGANAQTYETEVEDE
ncbi:hypothetical protein [Dethiobacter alkaliphilus]|uniref:hypothetical protein n=1 Tax=Dethiobacter alkaliphilus TaxID=427926 RepID=UPI002225CA50|nr:hypothetical protein [Dethiobacter alkaliphilus]MCW3491552.1 hypothetical protein [Dethiobacter alkaliphilus]